MEEVGWTKKDEAGEKEEKREDECETKTEANKNNNRKKLQFITLLTAICIVSHIENSKNDKGYIT